MQTKIIEINGLTKMYGDFTAVKNLSLTIEKGEIFGLLGPNGAGKSTTILMLMGLTEPTSGDVKVCGLNPVHMPIEAKKKIGYLPEDVGFYDDLTGFENLLYTAKLNRIPDSEAEEKARQLLQRVGLAEQMDKKTEKYSRGMLQRLGLADVLIKDPEVIIMDEPTLGIDPSGIREFLELIVRLSRKDGITVLFSSHQLLQVQQVCDRVGIFVNGKLLAHGDIRSLAQQLFSGENISVEVKIGRGNSDDKSSGPTGFSAENLTEEFKKIEGVKNVSWNNTTVKITCYRDVTPEIARVVINSGIGLNYLNKKEYGLDDIYYRYFEGGINDE